MTLEVNSVLICIFQMKVTKPDDTALEPDTLSSMKVTVTTRYKRGGSVTTQIATPSADGTIVINRDVPENADIVNIEVCHNFYLF